jgi:hypothetical protein
MLEILNKTNIWQLGTMFMLDIRFPQRSVWKSHEILWKHTSFIFWGRMLVVSCCCLLGLLSDPEAGSNTFLRNVGALLPDSLRHVPEGTTRNICSWAVLPSVRSSVVSQQGNPFSYPLSEARPISSDIRAEASWITRKWGRGDILRASKLSDGWMWGGFCFSCLDVRTHPHQAPH